MADELDAAAAIAAAEQIIFYPEPVDTLRRERRSAARRAPRPVEEFVLVPMGGPFRECPQATEGVYLLWIRTAAATPWRVRQPGWQTYGMCRGAARTWQAHQTLGAVGPLSRQLVAAFQVMMGCEPWEPVALEARPALRAELTRLLQQAPAMHDAYERWIARLAQHWERAHG